jgi:hypothetical protein
MRGTISMTLVNAAPPAYGPHRRRRQTQSDLRERDIPNAVVRFLDTGHFALETHAAETAAVIRDFLPN